VLGLIIWLVCTSALAEQKIPEEYREIAQSSAFKLYLQEDTMSIIVESKKTGECLYSAVQDDSRIKGSEKWKGYYQSGLIVEYLEGTSKEGQHADLKQSNREMAYTFHEQGFDLAINFTDLDISLSISLFLDDEGIHVEIPYASIQEKNREQYALGALYVFPFPGHTYMGEEEGYMLVPDGQGILIHLNNKEGKLTTPYIQPVYGNKSGISRLKLADYSTGIESNIMPIWGMAHTQKGIAYLGVIEEGDSSAEIHAYPNGVRTNFNWISAKFTYCMLYMQPLGPTSSSVQRRSGARAFDLKLHFLLTEGSEADYSGMANAYRAYLEKRGVFERADTGRAFDFRLEFLGLEREKALLGKQNVVMTTFAQAAEILSQLQQIGVEGLNITYRGWQEGGISGGFPLTGYQPAASLGGRNHLLALKKSAEEIGYQFSLEADFKTLNLLENPIHSFGAMKMITGEDVYNVTYGKVYDKMHVLLPEKSLEYAEAVMAGLVQDFSGVSLAGITSFLTDYKKDSNFHSGQEMMGDYRRLVSVIANQVPVELGAANAYLWPWASALYDLPMNGSGFRLTDEEIPFLSMVLSGKMPLYSEYMNFQSDSDLWLLKHVEQGIRPSFLFTWEESILLQHTNSSHFYSTQYTLFLSLFQEWHRQLGDVYGAIEGASILEHTRAGDITRVKWSNGTIIYLNFGQEDGVMDGIALAAMDYKVVQE